MAMDLKKMVVGFGVAAMLLSTSAISASYYGNFKMASYFGSYKTEKYNTSSGRKRYVKYPFLSQKNMNPKSRGYNSLRNDMSLACGPTSLIIAQNNSNRLINGRNYFLRSSNKREHKFISKIKSVYDYIPSWRKIEFGGTKYTAVYDLNIAAKHMGFKHNRIHHVGLNRDYAMKRITAQLKIRKSIIIPIKERTLRLGVSGEHFIYVVKINRSRVYFIDPYDGKYKRAKISDFKEAIDLENNKQSFLSI